MQSIAFLSVDTLASAKALDAEQLRREFGLEDLRYAGQRAVRIPYRASDGSHLFRKIRLADGSMRYDPIGVTPTLYGLDRLARAAVDALVLLVEGESDCWAATQHNVLAIGIPGANGWRSEFAALLAGRKVVVWEEPDPAGAKLVQTIARNVPAAQLVAGTEAVKDPGDLHQLVGAGFAAAMAARFPVPIGARAAEIIRRQPSPPARRRVPRALSNPDRFDDAALERAKRRSVIDVMLRAGVRFRARSTTAAWCPLHEDTHPSLSVSEKRGLWKCHGCGAAGDAITFIMKVRGVDFRTAVSELAR